MDISFIETAERVSMTEVSDNYVFQRHKLAYCHAAKMATGNVLEIGTGNGYGISHIIPYVDRFVTIDKNNKNININIENLINLRIIKMKVPSLAPFPDESFDAVISFQVIEHVKNDSEMIKEISRVLKPGGKLIISTPNKKMSLTRNPWHVREYTVNEFTILLKKCFPNIETFGVFGNQKVMEYYEENKKSVEKFTKFDILKFQYWLPKWLLRLPYDILNRINRKKLLVSNTELTINIDMNDYFIKPVNDDNDNCFDLFYTATK